ncbi:hypothetical protein PEX1_031480 [Penicillium expansum]|uniref:Uncharacterized protein n=1 Tax=Penicillium expansum TaxID=27334 RepID=A0A0A2JHN5_PENEN|nr:hypothetical protein PEX2_015260 [Penicillium expansum]KGO54917.1 hypothetical protein PEX1_031480 [Penicillium expansum]KGO61847.1 hypothetical protein PEX2_015260 [Penicillium expansum]
MQSSRGETWRSSRKPSAIQDSATESAKQAIEGFSQKGHARRPGSLVVTSYLEKTENSGQDKALSWKTASWYSLGEDWSIAIIGNPYTSKRPDDHHPLSPRWPIIDSKAQNKLVSRRVVSGILALLALNKKRATGTISDGDPSLHCMFYQSSPARTLTSSSRCQTM